MIGLACLYAAQAETFSYDSVGRLVQSTGTNGLSYAYAYDPAGNLAVSTLSSPDVGIGGQKGNGIADWWEFQYLGGLVDPLSKGADGVPFLMKFALGLDPTQNVLPGDLPEGTVDGTNMTLVFRKSRAASNLIFVVQSSNDLMQPWTDLTDATNAALALPPLLSDDISDSYKVSIPFVGDKQFMRLKVSNP